MNLTNQSHGFRHQHRKSANLHSGLSPPVQ